MEQRRYWCVRTVKASRNGTSRPRRPFRSAARALEVNSTTVLPLRADQRQPFSKRYATLMLAASPYWSFVNQPRVLPFYDSPAEPVAPQWFTSETTSWQSAMSLKLSDCKSIRKGP